MRFWSSGPSSDVSLSPARLRRSSEQEHPPDGNTRRRNSIKPSQCYSRACQREVSDEIRHTPAGTEELATNRAMISRARAAGRCACGDVGTTGPAVARSTSTYSGRVLRGAQRRPGFLAQAQISYAFGVSFMLGPASRRGFVSVPSEHPAGYSWRICRNTGNASVAQLDRASASGAEGRRFESCQAHQYHVRP